MSWFADPGERAGIFRYGSLLGALPVIGAALPLALFATLMLEMTWITRSIFLILLFLGTLLSLSKGAVAGAALAIVLFLILSTKSIKRQGITILVVIGVAVSLLVSLAGPGTVLGQSRLYVVALFLEDSSGRGGDVTLQQSMEDRWTSLPAQSLGWLHEARGDAGILVGGGFQMLGSALMPNDDSPYYTSHDTYIDFVLIAGLPLLIAHICLVIGTLIRFRSPVGQEFLGDSANLQECALGMILILALGGLFSAEETFQPTTGSVWCFLVGAAMRIESMSTRNVRLKW